MISLSNLPFVLPTRYGSHLWKAISKVRTETLMGIRWSIGNRRQCPLLVGLIGNAWKNLCIFITFLLFLRIFWINLWRSLQMETAIGGWNLLDTCFLIAQFSKLVLLNRLGKRKGVILFFGPTLNRVIFTVKSAYHAITKVRSNDHDSV